MSDKDVLDVIVSIKERMEFNLDCVVNVPVTGRALILSGYFEYELGRCDALARLLCFELQTLDEDLAFLSNPPDIPMELLDEYTQALDEDARDDYEEYLSLLTRVMMMFPYYRSGLSMVNLLSRGFSPLSDSNINSLIRSRGVFENLCFIVPDGDHVHDYIDFCLEEISLVLRATTGKEVPEDEAVFHMQWASEIDFIPCHEECMKLVDFGDGCILDLFRQERIVRWSIIIGKLVAIQVYGSPSTNVDYEW